MMVREAIVTPPFAEPLLGSRHTSFAVPTTWVRVTRSSLFDEMVEELLASCDDRWLRRCKDLHPAG
jgi:hypothetical protein